MTESLPLFPLGTVLFPGMLLPLHVFEERYRALMREQEGQDPVFGVVLTRQGREVGDRPEIHQLGTAATLVGSGRYPDGSSDIVVLGGRRFRVVTEDWSASYLRADIEWLDEHVGASPEADDLGMVATEVARLFERFLDALERVTAVTLPREALPEDPRDLAYSLCSRLPLHTWERQSLLAAASDFERLSALATLLRRERDLLVMTGVGGATVSHPGAHLTVN